MRASNLDYERFGRQIALPEIGAAGQQVLARDGVRIVPAFGAEAVSERAIQLYVRAGGTLDDRSDLALRVPAVKSVPARLGVAAFTAIEAARRTLGCPPADLPDGLLEHLEVSE